MASTILDLVVKGGSIYYDGALSAASKQKFTIIGSRYATLTAFKSASRNVLNALKTEEGVRCFKPLTDKEASAIAALQRNIDVRLSIEENFIIILTHNFIRKQMDMLQSLTIETLNANPILCKALKINTSADFIKYYAYAAISRSIVTSMGYLVQDLLLYSNANVYDGKAYEEGSKTKWDLVVEGLNSVRSYIEVKSGPNDMDAAQVKHYANEINLIEEKGHQAFIGITYGRRNVQSVSMGLLATYVPDWRSKVLIGRELWDYVSGNRDYHNLLLQTIQSTAATFIAEESLVAKIDQRIAELITVFDARYVSMEEYYNTLW